MKRATKEKKTPKKINKVNNKKSKMFDYEQEVKTRPEKLTRKANTKRKKGKSEEQVKHQKKQENDKKKRIKELQKKKRQENERKAKEIREQEKNEKTNHRKKVKRKLTIKEIKRKQRANKTIRITILIFIAIGAVLLLLLSPIFNVKEVRIEGNEKVSKQEILSLIKIGKDTNIFKASDNYIKEKLKQNAYINIDETTTRKILPEIIEINIKERSIEFQLEFGSSFAYIDKLGNIMEISSKSIENTIKLLGYETSNDNIKPGSKLDEKDISKINDIIQINNTAKNYGIQDKITSINIKDSDDYVMYLENEKKTVHLGNNNALETKMLYTKAILEREKDIEGEIFVNMDLNKKNAYFKQNV